MPIEIRRFGVGNRRPTGPPGTAGIAAQVIHSDARGTIAEMAFGREAAVEPHASPNTTFFVVIEGGGWVLVGDEKTRVAAGEAVIWPPDVPHGAWTEQSPMRAFVVEFAGPDDSHVRGIIEGRTAAMLPDAAGTASAAGASRGEGTLAEREEQPVHDPDAGEPL